MQRSIKTISVLSDIVEDQYKSALLTIAKQKEETPDLKVYSIIRDAAKVLSLRYTTAINQAIIEEKSFEKGIKPLLDALTFIFKVIIPEYDDNHYSQVIINLKMTYEVANHKMNDYKDQFKNWIEVFNARALDTIELDETWEPKFSDDTIAKLKEADNVDYYKWHDTFHSNNIGVVYESMFGLFKENFKTWIGIHKSIFKRNSNSLTGNAFLNKEEELGINLRKYANE